MPSLTGCRFAGGRWRARELVEANGNTQEAKAGRILLDTLAKVVHIRACSCEHLHRPNISQVPVYSTDTTSLLFENHDVSEVGIWWSDGLGEREVGRVPPVDSAFNSTSQLLLDLPIGSWVAVRRRQGNTLLLKTMVDDAVIPDCETPRQSRSSSDKKAAHGKATRGKAGERERQLRSQHEHLRRENEGLQARIIELRTSHGIDQAALVNASAALQALVGTGFL